MKNREGSAYILTIVTTLILLVVMISYNFVLFYKNTASNMRTIGQTCLARETEALNSCLSKGVNVLQVTSVLVEQMMKNGASADQIRQLLVDESKRYAVDIDEDFVGVYGVFNDEYIDGIDWVPYMGYDPYLRDWYTAALEGKGQPVIVSPYIDTQTGNIMFSVSKLLYDGKSVIALDITMNKIQEITRSINLDGMGYGFIVDRNGLVVAHNDENEKGKNYIEDKGKSSLIASVCNDDNSVFETKLDGRKCTVFKNKVMDNWYVVMVVSNAKLFYDIKNVTMQSILVCFVIFTLIALFCLTAFRRMKMSMKSEEAGRKRLEEMNKSIVIALARAIDAKDRYTNGHSQRVATYASELAKRMGKSDEEQAEIYYAGLLHDVGKIRVPSEVINKPGKLTIEEFEKIKIHPVTGYHILKDIYIDKLVAMGAKFHHERYDGRGYPNGLKGKNIPEVARIIGVADAYDAMASNRSYRKALPQEIVRSEIENGCGTQFDPEIAKIMMEMIDEDKDYTMKENPVAQKTILVVDDEPINIKMITHIMRDEPMYRIISAGSGEETLEIIKDTDIDLILLDVKMPGMDGFETLEKIRKSCDVPVVFMTADKNIETIYKASALGVDDYITKPFLALALKEIIHGMLKSIN